jgi:hypothetical protein
LHSRTKLRTYASFTCQAGSWTRPRKVVARLECSLQPDGGDSTSTGMHQEVDDRYVVTSLKGTAQHLYEDCLLPARADGKPDQAAPSWRDGSADCRRFSATNASSVV